MTSPYAGGGYYAAPQPAPVVVRGVRSVGRCFLLLLVSFGLWSFAWMWHTTNEVSRQRDPSVSAGLRTFLVAIPIGNWIVTYQAWDDINEYCERYGVPGFNVALYLVLSIVVPFASIFTFISVQNKMNDAHVARLGGNPPRAPMSTADWVTVGIGLGLFVLYVLLIVVIIIAAAGSSS
jgi:uncharacterized membrane protein YidH (DUF202 family)